MTQHTKHGRELAESIRKSLGYHANGFFVDIGTCSLICRHTRTYHGLQEDSCNGHPIQGQYVNSETTDMVAYNARVSKLQDRWDTRIERREGQIERRVTELAQSLPNVKAVQFGGDPRGSTVTLVMKNKYANNWARDGVSVPHGYPS